MLFPAILTDIDDLVFNRLIGSTAIPPRMSPILVVIKLINAQLVLQVNHCPEEGLIQIPHRLTSLSCALYNRSSTAVAARLTIEKLVPWGYTLEPSG